MLVEVKSLETTREIVPSILEKQGYDYFWRPTWGDDIPPFYAWFIKRNEKGERAHHIHMVESDFEHWDRLLFRDYLIEFKDVATEYKKLKMKLAKKFAANRIKYTEEKTEFITRITQEAKNYYEII